MSVDLRYGDYRDAMADVTCDLLCSDTPYSDRTHSSYRDMAEMRRAVIGYASWSDRDVFDFVDFWHPRTRGWFVTLTDHVLAPVWEAALASAGRYVFSPIACVEPGRSVRICGDGPSQWSCQLIVARPRNRAFAKWGALPGAYVVPGGEGRAREFTGVTGGKPLWLMRSIIRDYSRPGDIVCDPCCGAGTTLLAARAESRESIGCEIDAETYALACTNLLGGPRVSPAQEDLFAVGVQR